MTLFPALALPVYFYDTLPDESKSKLYEELNIDVEEDDESTLISRDILFFSIDCIQQRRINEHKTFRESLTECTLICGGTAYVIPLSVDAVNTIITEHILAHK